MRLRATFSKTEAMRFTGHLDLFRTLERTIRRAKLPLVYSQGYNRRPKLALASALPLGYTSEHELADLWLEHTLSPTDVKAALEQAAPPGIIFHELKQIALDTPQMQTQTLSASYLITLPEPDPTIAQRLCAMMDAKEILLEKVRKKKKRVFDLRQLILEAELLDADDNGVERLKLKLRAEEGATGRPDDVLTHLGIDPLQCRVHRLAIELKPQAD